MMTVPFGEAFWDERYRQHGSVWSRSPNPQLVAEAAGLRPGSALDVGSGEGADSTWLARHGWRVTAVDISSVALARAAARAAEDAEVAGQITWAHQDLTSSPPPAGTFDLVSVQFMHVPAPERTALYQRLAAAVAPGGTLLIVGHHPTDLGAGVPRPSSPGLLFAAEEIAADLDPEEWEILVCEARPRPAEDPAGNPVTVTDSVLRARRK
ncbi:class I SAM-dependent methyltransferase [Pseudarthrobacter sp. H2]|uniref:class I SAM-dependent methyltransferase n=1 Tax=Pseudarthrobacter sp. H2 TaxID=3418415 RepID=UPI003CF284C4